MASAQEAKEMRVLVPACVKYVIPFSSCFDLAWVKQLMAAVTVIATLHPRTAP